MSLVLIGRIIIVIVIVWGGFLCFPTNTEAWQTNQNSKTT